MRRARSDGQPPSGMKLFDDPRERTTRLAGPRVGPRRDRARARQGRTHWEGWEDSAVPPERLGDYLRDLRELARPLRLRRARSTATSARAASTPASTSTSSRRRASRSSARSSRRRRTWWSRYGGSLSGEHGDGQARAELLPKMFGDELVRRLPRVQGDLGSRREDEPGQGRRPLPRRREPAPRRRLPARASRRRTSATRDDHGELRARDRRAASASASAARRAAATMCPSYMATREEKHSTRGRARLLFEMLAGRGPHGTAGSDERSRRRSTSASPARAARATARSSVDMATYKAEFLSHYYEAGSGRAPPTRWADRLVGAARLARARARQRRHAARRRSRRRCKLARRDRAGARRCPRSRPRRSARGSRRAARTRTRAVAPVVLWPDTFNNHFHPTMAQAAVEVLEAAGCAGHRPRGPSAAAGRSTTTACSTSPER